MRSIGEFDDQKQGIVTAAGTLSITFSVPLNQSWSVKQITLEMPNAPTGATAEIRKGSALVAPSPDARAASAAGDPPVPVRAGESISVSWEGATPGDIGVVYIIYEKLAF